MRAKLTTREKNRIRDDVEYLLACDRYARGWEWVDLLSHRTAREAAVVHRIVFGY